MTTPRYLPILLALCMFTTGASGLVNQYVLATVTTYILGNSIEQFSMVIASMMLMMGVSGLVQNKMSDDHLLEKFIIVEVAMAIIGGFAPLAVYAAFGYVEYSFQIIHYMFVLSIGFLIGFEIPLVMRIIEHHKIKLRTNLTIVYAMDYIGAFVGAVVWVKIFLKNYPLTEISFIVAGFNFLVAAVTILYFVRLGLLSRNVFYCGMLAVTAIMLVVGFNINRPVSELMEQRFYSDKIIHKATTKYQHIVVTHNQTLDDTRLYINGNTQFSSTDEARYHELLVHPVMHLSDTKKHVLILGGGDGLALRELNKYSHLESITLVDLDPGMVELASTHPVLKKLNDNAFDNARVHTEFLKADIVDRKSIFMNEPYSSTPNPQWITTVDVFNIDADQFLRTDLDRKWGVVIIDLPDPSAVELAKLYSKQFYQTLRTHMTPDANLVIQSTSPYHAKRAYVSIGHTLRAAGFTVLPFRQNIPSFGDWGFYMAWTDDRSQQNVKQSFNDLQNIDVPTTFVTPEVINASFVFGKDELTVAKPCINTLMRPCLLDEYLNHSWNIE